MTDTARPQGPSLGIGAMISDAFTLSFANIAKVFAVMVVPVLLMVAATFALLGSLFFDPEAMTNPDVLQQRMESPGFWAAYAVAILVSVLLYSFIIAAVIQIVFDAKAGGNSGLGKAFSVGFARALQVFAIMAGFYIGLAIAFGILFGIVGVVAVGAGMTVLGPVLGLAGFVLFIWVMGAILPLLAIVVIENRWISSIGRSMSLTAGYRWPNVLLMILFMLATLVVYLIMALASVVAGMLGVVGMVIGFVIGLIGMVIVIGSGMALVTLDYVRLREIKEGTSLGTLADVFD